MSRSFIVTVGTSLLTNRDEDSKNKRPWAGWRSGAVLPEINYALKYLRDVDPVEASAETNTLSKCGLNELDRVCFLFSDTEEGEWCATSLEGYFKESNEFVWKRKISNLNYQEEKFAGYGLKDFVRTLFEEIRNNRNYSLALCATGGFKPETAYMSLVGALCKYPVYYIHEKFRELVEFPPFPISWNFEIVEKNRTFFEWIEEEERSMVEVESWLKREPTLRDLVVEEQEKCYLNATGLVLIEAFKLSSFISPINWPSPCPLSPVEKVHISEVAHHRPAGWEKVIERLAGFSYVSSIRFDGSGDTTMKKSNIVIKDENTGTLSVVYCKGDKRLPILVETTARSSAQIELVTNWIRRNIVS